MNVLCILGHRWIGCRCERCGKVRDVEPVSGGQTQPVRLQGHVLLTRRVPRHDEVPTEVDGFAEVYVCTTCKDEFVLGWQREDSPLRITCEEVSRASLPELEGNLEELRIFCPRCKMRHDVYGPVLWPGQEAVAMIARGVFSFMFAEPGHASEDSQGSLLLDEAPCDPVILVSGDLPDEPERTNLFGSFFACQLDAFRTKAMPIHAGGPLAVQAVWVDKVIDETGPLIRLLRETLYRERGAANFLCMSFGVLELKPPLGHIVLCLVDRGGE